MSSVSSTEHAEAPLAETPDIHGAYPRLSDDQIEILETGGVRRPIRPGDILVREGTCSDEFFVILSGKVAIIAEDDTGKRRTIRVAASRPKRKTFLPASGARG